MNKIIHGDCIEELKKLPENSVDAIITDPPYGLGFMNKEWDSYDPTVNKGSFKVGTGSHPQGYVAINKPALQKFCYRWATECLRVLKHGGFLLSFGGTRTYHRMNCAIEDAGFEIRDTIMWIYGSGFPKSLNVRLNMEKQIDKFISKENIDLIWKSKIIKNVCDVEKLSLKDIQNQEIILTKENSVQDIVAENIIQITEQKNALIVEKKSQDQNHYLKEEFFVIENVEQNIQQQKQNVKYVENLLLKKIVKSKNQNIFIVEGNVKELLKESIKEIIKEEEVQKIWLGKWLYSKEMDINANFVELIENFKHTILKKLKIIQNSGTNFQMESLIATNVIITKFTMECLITSMGDIVKEIIKKNYEGIGTALKPAMELIVVARKPLSEKNVALNVLKWGTGGINIDDCRIGYISEEDMNDAKWGKVTPSNIYGWANTKKKNLGDKNILSSTKGRFPANIILECTCDELKEGTAKGSQGHWAKSKVKGFRDFGGGTQEYFGVGEKDNMKCVIHTNPNCPCYMLDEQSEIFKGEIGRVGRKDAGNYNATSFKVGVVTETGIKDKGGASRFFYCAKASKSERKIDKMGGEKCSMKTGSGNERNVAYKNNHPTVKPIKLMEYLIKLVSKEGAVVLDPFLGSGTTAIASLKLNRKFIGIEKEEEYIKICEARIKGWEDKLKEENKQKTL